VTCLNSAPFWNKFGHACLYLSLGAIPCAPSKSFQNFWSLTWSRWEIASGVQEGSGLSSPNFNSSVRAERSFAIRYPNVVIKPLCDKLHVLSVADCDRKWKMLFVSQFLDALLSSLPDFTTGIQFGHAKAEHANAPNVLEMVLVEGLSHGQKLPLVFRFWSRPCTNGPNTQLKWKLR